MGSGTLVVPKETASKPTSGPPLALNVMVVKGVVSITPKKAGVFDVRFNVVLKSPPMVILLFRAVVRSRPKAVIGEAKVKTPILLSLSSYQSAPLPFVTGYVPKALLISTFVRAFVPFVSSTVKPENENEACGPLGATSKLSKFNEPAAALNADLSV